MPVRPLIERQPTCDSQFMPLESGPKIVVGRPVGSISRASLPAVPQDIAGGSPRHQMDRVVSRRSPAGMTSTEGRCPQCRSRKAAQDIGERDSDCERAATPPYRAARRLSWTHRRDRRGRPRSVPPRGRHHGPGTRSSRRLRRHRRVGRGPHRGVHDPGRHRRCDGFRRRPALARGHQPGRRRYGRFRNVSRLDGRGHPQSARLLVGRP